MDWQARSGTVGRGTNCPGLAMQARIGMSWQVLFSSGKAMQARRVQAGSCAEWRGENWTGNAGEDGAGMARRGEERHGRRVP
jgi:hypothetical protein